jgi:hypothetical protein
MKHLDGFGEHVPVQIFSSPIDGNQVAGAVYDSLVELWVFEYDGSE